MLKKRLGAVFLFLSLLWGMAVPAWANNQVGIHILETTEVNKAAELVNSSGGDWGYVTIVLREDDLDLGKWQTFFDQCRRLHLIPIVRIATQIRPGGTWARPNLDDLAKWSKFLGQLNWPVKQQIVTIFNEPNHAKEWGGTINPREYALVLDQLISLFKAADENFFVLAAGFDQAAGNTGATLDEATYLSRMAGAVPGIFNRLDGWASHSYPNHGFVGLPEDTGRATIRGYQWELAYLRRLGLNKDLPIFITETGWPHAEGGNGYFYGEGRAAEFIQKALTIWQKDDQIKAVTPFVLNYPQPPFGSFSWLKPDGQPYPQFNQVLGVSKQKGEPEQVQSYEVSHFDLPELLPTNYTYQGRLKIKNTGQWIMGERESFSLPVASDQMETSDAILLENELIEPGQEKALKFEIKTGSKSAEYTVTLNGEEKIIYTFRPFDLTNKRAGLFRQVQTALRLWWENFKNG